MDPAVKTRSASLYRVALAVPALALVFLVWSGRLPAYFRSFSPPDANSKKQFAYHFTTALIWIVSLVPLNVAAWEMGRQHTAAHRFGYDLLVGFREVCRIAIRGGTRTGQFDKFARPPRDRPWTAAILGGITALVAPAFFLTTSPMLRTPRGFIWLAGAGVLMGITVYADRRAVAYLLEEPGSGDFFYQWRRLDPARYRSEGRPLVRLRIGATVAVAIWRLFGGSLLVGGG